MTLLIAFYSFCFLFAAVKTNPVPQVFSWCDGRYCFHSDGSTAPRTLEQAQSECKSLRQNSWPLEIYSQVIQDSVMKYIGQFEALKKINILLNLRRFDDSKWKWIDGTTYNDEFSDSNLKVRIFNKGGPFATLRNLPLRGIYGDTYTTTKLEQFLCSYNYDCGSNKTATTVGGVCYVKYYNKTFGERNSGVTWFDAYHFCYKNGGKLATFDKMSSETFQKKLLSLTSNWENYWIGMVNSHWGWLHKFESTSNFSLWYTGYPYPNYINEDPKKVTSYLYYYDGGIWMDTDKNIDLGLICMSDQKSKRSRIVAF